MRFWIAFSLFIASLSILVIHHINSNLKGIAVFSVITMVAFIFLISQLDLDKEQDHSIY